MTGPLSPPGEGRDGRPRVAVSAVRYHGPQPEEARGARARAHHRIRKTGWSGAMRCNSLSAASGPTPWKNMPVSHFHFFR